MRRFIALIVSVWWFIGVCVAQIQGPWHGVVQIGMQKLPIVFNINEDCGKFTATMDSPNQGAKGLPAEIVQMGDTINISIPIIGAHYQGIYREGTVDGVFEQSGLKLQLALESGEYVAPRPQTPQPPYLYETKEVTIINPDDGYQLHGTLTLPSLYNPASKKKYNAVVMVSGSGIQNRDEEIYGHRPFAVIAHHLALNGIASLRYDDRGYNDTIANALEITTQTNTSDAKAAIDYLRSNIDRLDQIGVIGHSEGGTIALILGAEGDSDFVVSLAGSAVRGDSILLKQNESLLIPALGEDLTQRYIAGLSRTLQYMEQNPGVNEWSEIEEALSDLNLMPELVGNLAKIVESRNAWIDYFISYDPTEIIKHVDVPVYAANGTLDIQVDSQQNLGALRRYLPANTATIIKEYPGLNHLMQECKTGMPAEYAEIDQTISPQLLQDISHWIKSLK